MKVDECTKCGICCKLFLINLNEDEWTSGKYKTALKGYDLGNDFKIVQKYGGNVLKQKKDGSCIYLKKNLCSIHTRSPQACRDFSCTSKAEKFKGMIRVIKERNEKDATG
jgi:Fe-S-cluster containining protein